MEDDLVEVVPAAGRNEAVVCFTAHAYVATALPAADVLAQGPDGAIYTLTDESDGKILRLSPQKR